MIGQQIGKIITVYSAIYVFYLIFWYCFIFLIRRSEENVSILSKDNKNIQDPKIQTAEEKIQSLQTENSSLVLALAKKSTE